MKHKGLPRIKILASIEWFTPAFRAGGIISSLSNQIHHLSDRLDFWVVCSNRDLTGPLPKNLPLGQWMNRGNHHVMYLDGTVNWSEIINALCPDFIYINGLFNGAFCRDLLKNKNRKSIPTVIAPHGMLAPQALAIKKWLKTPWLVYRQVFGDFEDLIWHASNETEAHQIQARFKHAEVRVAQNLPPPITPNITPPKAGIRCLSVGRIHPIKNYGFAAECLARCADTLNTEITYQIVGAIEDESEHSAILKRGTNTLSIDFVGEKQPSELGPYYQNAQCLLVPSLSENFGLVVAEALGHGLPVIVSDNTPWGQYPSQDVLRCLPLESKLWTKAISENLAVTDRDSISKEAQAFFAHHLESEGAMQQHIQLFA